MVLFLESPPPLDVCILWDGVEKANGKLRPITDCSMPGDRAINNFMIDTSFSYNSVYTAADLLKGDEFMSVVDLKSAYRSVNIFGPRVGYQVFFGTRGLSSNTTSITV